MFYKVFVFCIICTLTACSKPHDPVAKATLRVNLFTEPPSLDPRKATDSSSMNVLLMLFDGLTRIGPNHKPYPAVAESIKISDDCRTYTFKLRPSVWSNGDPVTASDFLYTWQSILDPQFPSLFAYKFYVIENAAEIKSGKLPKEALGVRALDSQTLEVTLKYPTPYFLELTAFPSFFPVHQKTGEKNPDWAADSGPDYVSNGPFRLSKWEHESEIIAEKNPLYWDAGVVRLEEIQLAMIDDTSTEYYMFEMGELDWAGSPISNLSPELIPELKAEGKVTFFPASAVYYYKLNTLVPPLGNVNIRKALAYAINRHDIVEHITQAGQTPALSLIPPMPGWEKPVTLFPDGNAELARHYFNLGLSELGMTKDAIPVLTLSFNSNREHQKIAQAIQQQWKDALDLEVRIEHFDWKVFLSKLSRMDYQIGRMGWVGDFYDPVSFLEPFKYNDLSSDGGNNDTGWENPDYIACLNAAQKEIDPVKRGAILRKAEEILISEMPLIPIYFITLGYLKKPYVHGVYVSPLGVMDMKDAYLEQKEL